MSITLSCLVKGNTSANAFSVKINRDEPVSELKKVIKAEKYKTFLGIEADELRLWKVEIGGDHLDNQLRNLSFENKDELSAITEIGDYWTKKPPKKSVHVIVEPPVSSATTRKFTSLKELSESEFYEPPNKRVKTDNEKVNNFWRELKNASLTKKFLKLPENTRFLGKTHGHSILYIRKCYKDLKRIVFDNKIDKLRISGNPGIGKTIFGYYLLYSLAKKNATIVYDNHKETEPIVFNGEHAFKSNDDEINSYLEDANVWYIVDGKEPKDVDAKTILICSTKRSHYKNFDNYDGEGTIRYMPIWSWKEIKMCRKHIYMDKVGVELARDLFSKWGGIPRYVLEKANSLTYQNKLKDAINSCNEDIFDDIGESSVERTLASHMVIHIHVNLPLKDEVDKDKLSQYSETELQLDRNGITPYTETILKYASNHVRERVTERLETRIRKRLVEQIKAGTGSPLLGSSFEYIAHKILRSGGKFDVRPLEEYADGNNDDEDAKVDLNKQDLGLYFGKNNINNIQNGMYYQASDKNFPSVDSVIAPNKVFQMTIARVHPINMSGLKLLYDKLGGRTADHLIYCYFVVPEHIYDHQKFVNSKDKTAKIIPAWMNNRVFQYVLKIKL